MSTTALSLAPSNMNARSGRAAGGAFWVAVGMAMIGAVLMVAGPAAGLLVYDREAILAGDWWRLLTGHFVHFSWSHYLLDALVLMAAGMMIQRRRLRGFVAVNAAAAVVIGGLVFLAAPSVRFYAGFSGLAYAALSYLAMDLISTGGRGGRLGVICLLALATKLAWETATGMPLLAGEPAMGWIVLPAAHLGGVAVGMIAGAYWLAVRASERRSDTRFVDRLN